MTLDPEKVAQRLGATYVGQAPVTDGGAFGMAGLAEVLKERLDSRGGRRQGTAIGWILGSKVQMSPETERMLMALAEKLSTPERRVNPMELAAELLEESVQRLTNQKAQ
jgi:hypothetical protein